MKNPANATIGSEPKPFGLSNSSISTSDTNRGVSGVPGSLSHPQFSGVKTVSGPGVAPPGTLNASSNSSYPLLLPCIASHAPLARVRRPAERPPAEQHLERIEGRPHLEARLRIDDLPELAGRSGALDDVFPCISRRPRRSHCTRRPARHRGGSNPPATTGTPGGSCIPRRRAARSSSDRSPTRRCAGSTASSGSRSTTAEARLPRAAIRRMPSRALQRRTRTRVPAAGRDAPGARCRY